MTMGHSASPAIAGRRWPDGLVPFECVDTVDTWMRSHITKSIATIEMACGVHFHETKADVPRLVFVPSGGDYSEGIGYLGKPQTIGLSIVATYGTALHEICHALGMWHEHVRPERKGNVEIVESNVRAGFLDQFAVDPRASRPDDPYDFESIMHYGPSHLPATIGAITIRRLVPREPGASEMGTWGDLSKGDRALLRRAYGAP